MSEKIHHLKTIQKALAFLQSKGIDELHFGVQLYSWSTDALRLEVPYEKLTEDQLRLLKRHFGPFTIGDGYSAKDFKGACKIDDSLTITLTITKAYKCEKLDPTKLTEEKWDDIKSKIREGLVTIDDCTPVEVAASV